MLRLSPLSCAAGGAPAAGVGLPVRCNWEHHSLPAAIQTCENNGGTNCDSPDNHFDSMLALDLKIGAVKWATGHTTTFFTRFAAVITKNHLSSPAC